MAISISFDSNNKPIEPTLVLMNRSGTKLGAIPAYNINATDNLNSYSELFFAVDKVDAENIWDSIVDFKLVWVREWNQVYEIYVEYKESQGYTKNVTAKSLGHAELSQINIYDLNANNDTDIENDDTRTVLYNATDSAHSLINRIIDEKAPHYTVNHVDTWLRNIQRTFEFNGISIVEAFSQIAEEIDCIFIIDTSVDGTTGNIKRQINVYDLEYYCSGGTCNYRGNYMEVCPECGGTNILPGYGDDTTIFVSADNLSDEIDLSVNTDSVKNCFKLEAGDDLMTATIRNCNPNGSQYLWYITDDVKADMPSTLVEKIEEYDDLYNFYVTDSASYLEVTSPTASNLGKYYTQDIEVDPETGEGAVVYSLTSDTTINTEHTYYIKNSITLDSTKVSQYNTVINKYKTSYTTLTTITNPLNGYQSLMNTYYDVIDFSLLLSESMMPSITISSGTVTAATQAAKITSSALGSVAVNNISSLSTATATSAIVAMAKTLIDSNFSVSATASGDIVKTTTDGVVTSATWTGTFRVTSYLDDSDYCDVSATTVALTGSTSDYIKQRITKLLSSDDKNNDDEYGIVALFKKTLSAFTTEITKYSLSGLGILSDCAQGVLDVLISMGAANTNTWYDDGGNDNDNLDDDVAVVTYSGSSSTGGTVNYYRSFYKPYYKRYLALQSEILTRESEIDKIDAIMEEIEDKNAEIQDILNFADFLGTTLWNVFSSYRRDEVYSNDNFISDGLNNSELFSLAREFLADAKKEIYKSATLQHTITATLVNLLAVTEFSPIIDYFKVGNWIRVKIEDNIYKLRLLSYSVDYENLNNIAVQFSDITKMIDGMSDIESILNSADSMATSYDYVKRQSKKGLASNEQLAHWVEDGLSLTNMKIVSTADEQNILIDDHGLLAKEYLPVTDEYDDKQLKIINRGLYVTNDNWKTSKAGIGDFLFYDPEEGEVVEGYGVIADTIVGKIILGEEVGIYNTGGTIKLDEDGFTLINDMTSDSSQRTIYSIKRKTIVDGVENVDDLMCLDNDGSLVLNGKVRINTTGGSSSTYNVADTSTIAYTAIVSPTDDDLASCYERINEVYTLTTDESVDTSKTYYTASTDDSSNTSYTVVVAPTAANLASYYELTSCNYVLTSDDTVDSSKTYYLSNIDMSELYEFTPGGYRLTDDTEYSPYTTYYTVGYAQVMTPLVDDIGSYYEKTDAAYTLTSDLTVSSSKTYYVPAYLQVQSPSVNNIATYYEYFADSYALTSDNAITTGKTYYVKTYSAATTFNAANASSYYEYYPTGYYKTEDESVDSSKTYYRQSYSSVSSPSTANISQYYEYTAAHYTQTDDNAIASGKTYYTVGYHAVSAPSASDLSTYYELVPGGYQLTEDEIIVSSKSYCSAVYTAVASPVASDLSSYYEKLRDEYALTTDTTVSSSKVYYTRTANTVYEQSNDDIASYYELSNGVYSLTSDTTCDSSKTYYTMLYSTVVSPTTASLSTYYEKIYEPYALTTDTSIDSGATYYTKSYAVVASPNYYELASYYEYTASYYALTTDTEIDEDTTYYTASYTAVTSPSVSDISTYYEYVDDGYAKTTDTSVVRGKTYYIVSYTAVTTPVTSRLSSYYEYITGYYELTSDTYYHTGTTYYVASYNATASPESYSLSELYEKTAAHYSITSDLTINSSKTYYVSGYSPVTSPAASGLSGYYEYTPESYSLTTDDTINSNHTYYSVVYNVDSGVTSSTFNTTNYYEYYEDEYNKTTDTAVNSSKSYYIYDNNGNYTLREVINGTSYEEYVNQRLHDEFDVEGQGIGERIKAKYTEITDDIRYMLESYQTQVGQYIQFDESGLVLGARLSNNTDSPFKTIIDNQSLRFLENNETVAYINGQQLYINNAVINQAMYIGNFLVTSTATETDSDGNIMHGLTIIHDNMVGRQ